MTWNITGLIRDLWHVVRKLLKLPNRTNGMSYKELDWDDVDELRSHAKDNMAEGYLSEGEADFLDAVFDELAGLREMRNTVEDMITSAVKREAI